MSRKHSLREALFGVPKDKPEVKPSGTIVLGTCEQSYGVSLSTSFADQVKVYNEDPIIKESILQFATTIISTGIFTTMNQEYTLVLLGKSAKDSVDDWNKLNDADNKMLAIATELVAFGNSFWLIGDGGFTNIPIQAIQQALPIDKTTPIYVKFDLQLTGDYGSKVIRWGEFVHFATNTTGKAPFGTGIILGLVAIPTDGISLYTIHKSVRKSMEVGFRKFSFGNEFISLTGMPDDKCKEMGEKISKMPTTGQRVVVNTPIKVELAVPQRTQSYDKWIDQIDKEFYLATGGSVNPNTEYTTKATAEAVGELFKSKIASLRRVIARQVEGLWAKVLDKLGYSGIEAGVRLHFGAEATELTLQDIKDFVGAGIMTKKEARKHLIKIAKVELEGEQIPEGTEKVPVEEGAKA